MNLFSIEFLLLVMICRLAAVALSTSLQNYVFLGASLLFCLSHSPLTLAFLFGTFLIAYFSLRLYRRTKGKWALPLGILLILATWIASRVLISGGVTGMDLTNMDAGFVLGLSFYMLQAISVLLKSVKHESDQDPTFMEFLLFLAFFPKLTAGPIEPPGKFIRQLRARPRPAAAETVEGFRLVIQGLFRKFMLGDSLLRTIPKEFFIQPGGLSQTELAAWLLALLFGIYNDFLGYTQIARGISRILGLKLSRNFRSPFFSRSISDAWLRWHITLSQWLREYLFFPISRFLARRFPNPRHIVPMLIPPLAVMSISGLWHGFQRHFLIWGFVMGLLIFLERLARSIHPPRPVTKTGRPWHWAKSTIRWSALVLSLIPFALPAGTSLEFVQSLLGGNPLPFPDTPVLLFIPLTLLWDGMQKRWGETFETLPVPRTAGFLLQGVLILLIFLQSLTATPIPFIYGGF